MSRILTGSSVDVEAHRSPMLDGVLGAANWWGDHDGCCSSWYNVNSYHDMVIDNYTYDKVGIQGYEGIPEYVTAGDSAVIRYWDAEKQQWVTHTMLITFANGTYTDMKYCAHTLNRKDVKLSDHYSASEIYYFLWILWYKLY